MLSICPSNVTVHSWTGACAVDFTYYTGAAAAASSMFICGLVIMWYAVAAIVAGGNAASAPQPVGCQHGEGHAAHGDGGGGHRIYCANKGKNTKNIIVIL